MRSLLMNAAGLAASVAFVFAVVAGATALARAGTLDARTARKVIHIALAHWWLIALAMFDDPWAASAGPAFSLLGASLVPAPACFLRRKARGARVTGGPYVTAPRFSSL